LILDKTTAPNTDMNNLVKWNAPKAMSMKYADLTRNLGFMSMEEMELPAMLNVVMIFYLYVSLFSFSDFSRISFMKP
jgi:hypothetical protein